MKDDYDKVESQHKELSKSHQKLQDEKNTLAEQLQAETELCQEAEEDRNRLKQRKAELEDLIQDFELKMGEEEEKGQKLLEEKKKLQQGIQDLEERYVMRVEVLFTDNVVYFFLFLFRFMFNSVIT